MAYILNYSGGTITINDRTLNSDTSLQLPGKNYIGYGDPIEQNLVDLMQNFAGATNPSNSIRGQLWFDTGSNSLKYNISPTKGTPTWVQVGSSDLTGVATLANTQTFTGAKTFTGGITSNTYTFDTGYNIRRETTPAPVIRMTVGGDDFAHFFYPNRYLVYGAAGGNIGELAAFGSIVGIDENITLGGAGVVGIHAAAAPGLGIGIAAGATNPAFSGAVFATIAYKPVGATFAHISCGNNPTPENPATANTVFSVDGAGNVRADGSYLTPAADYAEYFEWADGNPDAEDRVGYSVSLVGNKIKIAESGDTAIGVVSAFPAIIGDAPEFHWQGKYETDTWGRPIVETYTVWEWKDENNRVKSVASYNDISNVPPNAREITTGKDDLPLTYKKLNPAYDPNQPYVPRSERPEWAVIGLMGKLKVRKGQVVDPRWVKMRDVDANIEEYLVR